MKTIKIIDLLNKIANGEEVPKKIRYKNKIFEHWDNGNIQDYWHKGNNSLFDDFIDCSRYTDLNDKVEILDEEDEEDEFKELNKAEYQYSVCPPYKNDEEIIRIMNNNFECHQKAIRDIINNQKKIIERLNEKGNI